MLIFCFQTKFQGGKLPQGAPPGHPVEKSQSARPGIPKNRVIPQNQVIPQRPDITHFLYSACIPQSPVSLWVEPGKIK